MISFIFLVLLFLFLLFLESQVYFVADDQGALVKCKVIFTFALISVLRNSESQFYLCKTVILSFFHFLQFEDLAIIAKHDSFLIKIDEDRRFLLLLCLLFGHLFLLLLFYGPEGLYFPAFLLPPLSSQGQASYVTFCCLVVPKKIHDRQFLMSSTCQMPHLAFLRILTMRKRRRSFHDKLRELHQFYLTHRHHIIPMIRVKIIILFYCRSMCSHRSLAINLLYEFRQLVHRVKIHIVEQQLSLRNHRQCPLQEALFYLICDVG